MNPVWSSKMIWGRTASSRSAMAFENTLPSQFAHLTDQSAWQSRGSLFFFNNSVIDVWQSLVEESQSPVLSLNLLYWIKSLLHSAKFRYLTVYMESEMSPKCRGWLHPKPTYCSVFLNIMLFGIVWSPVMKQIGYELDTSTREYYNMLSLIPKLILDTKKKIWPLALC